MPGYRFHRVFPAFLLVIALVQAAGAAPDSLLNVVPDHPDHLYRLGEKAVFRVALDKSVRLAGGARASFSLSDDGERRLSGGFVDLADRRAGITGALDKPGFLRLEITLAAGKDTLSAVCAVGFAVESIRPTNVLPRDFDRFWRNSEAELMRVPLDAQVSRAESSETPGVSHYRVSLANIESSRVYGWLSVPAGEGPFPAVLYIPGAGVDEIRPRREYAGAGMVAFGIDVHGIPQDMPSQWYAFLREGPLRDYKFFGSDDPYRFYYRRVILGAMRALDYLCTREDVDTTRLAVAGSSQGGGLSLLVAGLDRRIKALTANVPALCDHTGSLHGRPPGWPRLLANGDQERVLRTCGYYDAALNAGLINVPARVGVGFIDRVCPPTTVYAAYNNLSGPKKIDNFPGMGHSYGEGWMDESVRWLKEMLGKSPAPSK